MAILEAKALTKRYGGVTALDDLSLSVEERSVLGITGPNGEVGALARGDRLRDTDVPTAPAPVSA